MAKEQHSFIDMFARLGQDLKLPSIDIERVIEHHRKNLEALERSAKAASTGANTIMKRQREMLQETLGVSGTASPSPTSVTTKPSCRTGSARPKPRATRTCAFRSSVRRVPG